jgi:hypothetical protein
MHHSSLHSGFAGAPAPHCAGRIGSLFASQAKRRELYAAHFIRIASSFLPASAPARPCRPVAAAPRIHARREFGYG